MLYFKNSEINLSSCVNISAEFQNNYKILEIKIK